MSRNSKMFTLSTILLIDLIALVTAGRPTGVVQTTTGPVQGQILRTTMISTEYAAFTGIRYAKPPVGYLRFKPPVPVQPWTQTYSATTPGNECPQLEMYTNIFKGSEDCLFLSVMTPVTNLSSPPAKLKSVMVWIHGGAFMMGSQSDSKFLADYLLERDVVYVPINYRLGALGFLSLGHKNATGNAGLKDQVLALKWIKANIQKFGGNPNNITLMGESAGAVSVGFHVLSEASRGLFHGAISMSGSPLCPWAFTFPTDAVSRAFTLGRYIGVNSSNRNTLLRALYRASTRDLVTKTPAVSPGTPFTPTLENANIAQDVFMSRCTVNKYNTGTFTKVPQLLGFMEKETASFIGYVVPSNVLKIVENTLASAGLSVAYHGLMDIGINKTTNLLFKAPIDTTQRLLVAQNGRKPVYYYYVTYTTPDSLHNIDQNVDIAGAGHADDLAYLFYTPHVNYSRNADDPTARTINRITTMWTNFAKYGNPTPKWIPRDKNSVGVTWPASGCAGTILNIGNDLKVEPRPTDLITGFIQTTTNFVLGELNACAYRTNLATCR